MELASKAGTFKNATTAEKARWPLAFKIQPQAPKGLSASGITFTKKKPERRWWSHLLYRGPNGGRVKVLYSKTKADSEILAQQFLKEKVVGFDMEWPWDDWKRSDKLQNKISLIQVATEDKIALFHIGLHTGETTDDILAPSLRKLIESPNIGKIGVSILNADFARLSKHFKVVPKAAVELSHLHRLVTFGGRKPELVSTKMISLAHLVQLHLEHPLYKGDVRTSDWSKPLSQEQIKYAAGDAYAGFMLYHCLNYKRLQMELTPPLPVHADKYLGYKIARIQSLYLEPLEEGGEMMTSESFFGIPTAPEDLSKSKGSVKSSAAPSTNVDGERKPTIRRLKVASVSALDPTSAALLEELRTRRKAFAAEFEVSESRVAFTHVLESLAQERPLTSEALLKIKDLGPQNVKQYGSGWMKVISSFMNGNGTTAPTQTDGVPSEVKVSSYPSVSTLHAVENPASASTPDRKSRRGVAVRPKKPDSSPAFGTPPPPRTPQLHTGLSFTLSRTAIAWGSSTAEDSDDSLPSLDFGESPSRRTSGQKRKRVESPTKNNTHNSSQKLHQTIKTYRYEKGVSKTQLPRPSPKTPKAVAVPTDSPTDHSTASAPLTPRSKIFRNKLVAFSKLVATRKQTDASRLVTDSTLELIARNPPQTHEELCQIPGIKGLFHACTDINMDLLAKIHKFAPVRNHGLAAQPSNNDKPLITFVGQSTHVKLLEKS